MLDFSYVADYGMPYLFAIYIALVIIMALAALLFKRAAKAED